MMDFDGLMNRARCSVDLPLASEVWGWDDAEATQPDPPTSRVYGLCFRLPGGGKGFLHHAGHYVGIALDGNVDRRVWEHLTGEGSPLIAAAVRAGLEVQVVLDLPGDRRLERRLHNQHGGPRKHRDKYRGGWCPLCSPPMEVARVRSNGLCGDVRSGRTSAVHEVRDASPVR